MSSCNTKNQKLFKFISPEQSRITFNNTLIENDPLSILDNEFFYNGAGVALGDLNNDGLLDVFFTANQADNQLYLNRGNFQFSNESTRAGIQKRIP